MMFVVDTQRHNDGESGLVGPFVSRELAEAFIASDSRCDKWSIVRSVVSAGPADDGGLVSAAGRVEPSSSRPVRGLSLEQESSFASAMAPFVRVAEREVVAEAEAREAGLRAELADRVDAAVRRVLQQAMDRDPDFDGLDRADIDAVTDAAVGVFVEWLGERTVALGL